MIHRHQPVALEIQLSKYRQQGLEDLLVQRERQQEQLLRALQHRSELLGFAITLLVVVSDPSDLAMIDELAAMAARAVRTRSSRGPSERVARNSQATVRASK